MQNWKKLELHVILCRKAQKQRQQRRRHSVNEDKGDDDDDDNDDVMTMLTQTRVQKNPK